MTAGRSTIGRRPRRGRTPAVDEAGAALSRRGDVEVRVVDMGDAGTVADRRRGRRPVPG